MEILEILKNSKDNIYLEDLDFFETELATGDYPESYVEECKEQIDVVRNWLCAEDELPPTEESQKEQIASSLFKSVNDIAPKKANPVAANMTPEEMIFSDIKAMRNNDDYKSMFKKYVLEKEEIDGAFVDKHYAFFMSWELDAIVSVKQLGEAFLEKYFGALDKEKIARYQIFSESFFMKHYAQMDATVVLTKGKNEWRKKEKRSKQLDVFLRLKGVKV